ncbi:MAG TPA: phosphoribosyltransferase family protein, partial [Patescibacteria group bacterium]|nr:phosphoribosyltransferase family protein [Patescibacteria group bacterium]
WKYRFARDVEKDIVFLTRQKVAEATSLFCSDMVVVPLPSATRRLFWRGFNPSLTLAWEFSNLYSMEVCQVLRKRFGKPQVGRSPKERLMNIRGAFELIEKGRVQEKKVVLVDDVWTTGSTLKEAGKVLKRDGRARRVYALTFARSLSHRG